MTSKRTGICTDQPLFSSFYYPMKKCKQITKLIENGWESQTYTPTIRDIYTLYNFTWVIFLGSNFQGENFSSGIDVYLFSIYHCFAYVIP